MKTHSGLGCFSLGIGDRFGHQARAQLRACILAAENGVIITPVWNKSNREHQIIGSDPGSVRAAASSAVKALNWSHPFFVDADHIRRDTVDRFIKPCDFFTIDVAESIAKPVDGSTIDTFLERHSELVGSSGDGGKPYPWTASRREIAAAAAKYLPAVREAASIYRHIAEQKRDEFLIEISMDETDQPQNPLELLVILAALADERIPAQTIAPKFTGRFNKGVDYAGDLELFELEFNEILSLLAYAKDRYALSKDLKLSLHSGSDKFSLYPIMRRALIRHRAGLHLKTAGTSWLEECIGLAEAGGVGLLLVKRIYSAAVVRRAELAAPYATVVDIDPARLPVASTVDQWTADELVAAIRHNPNEPRFNPHLRQLLHVGFRIAAEMGDEYRAQLVACELAIARNVTANLFDRHIKPLFL
jgi:tagaturonate epimerase